MNLEHDIVITGREAWLPEEVAGRSWRYAYRYSRAERNVYRKRRRIPVSLWAERHRVITMGAVQGPWRNSTTPYLAGIMDASFFPSIETIIICAADQVGKSECVNNCIGYAMDREPGPVLYVYPDEQTAKENSRDRILPMIESSPRLRSYLTGLEDDAASLRINLAHMPIYMAWARSAARLANKPIKYIVFDETDKYPETAGKREASPIRKGEKRLRTYRHSRKTWKLSTPTIEAGPIWQAMTIEAEAIFDFHVECPMCGHVQRMVFTQIKWPEGCRDPQRMELDDLARYECIACRGKWDDHLRNMAVGKGQWKKRKEVSLTENTETQREQDDGFRVSRNPSGSGSSAGSSEEGETSLQEYLTQAEPKRIGFHIPSWLSRFVGLSEVAAAFLKGRMDKNELKDFLNSHAAEPWKDYTVERKEEKILALRDERPAGVVPGGGAVAALVAGVDTQDNGFYYRIRAFGWGMEQESWGVRKGFVDSFEALAQVLFEERAVDPEGNEFHVKLVVQDAMGHQTDKVYDFVRQRQGHIFAAQGVDTRRMATPITWSNIEFYPATKRPIPGGIRLLRHDANYWKNKLAGKLEINPEDPGAFHLEAEADYEYAQHLCAEVLDDTTNLWICQASRPNHYWDCEVLCLVAAEVLRIRFWEKAGADRRPRTADRGQKPGWVGKREGWIKR